MADLLIDLDENETMSNSNTLPPTSAGSIDKRMAGNHRMPPQRDSFSDLASLMKAKKPYTPIPPPTPKPKLSVTTNGMQFASRNVTGGSLLSPLAIPFRKPGSVAAYLQEQEVASPMSSPPPILDYRRKDMRHLESVAEWVKSYPVDDDESERRSRTPSPPYRAPLLMPGLESTRHIGPVDPPTPAESVPPALSAFQYTGEPVVRLTKHVWDSMAKELKTLTEQKRELQEKVSELERHYETRYYEDEDVAARLGKLKYQNEANRDQKAAMGCSLNQKEVKIKKQQLEIDDLFQKLSEAEAKLKELGGVIGERDYLRAIISSTDEAHKRAISDLAASKDRELNEVRATIHELEKTVKLVTSERDAALRAQVNAGDHMNRAQNLADTLVKREKIITDLRHKHLEEQMKVSDLEDEVEMLRNKVNQESIDDLKEKLREKTSLCDRQRNQLKMTEQHLKVSQDRIMRAANNGESLRGAAHLVMPNAKCKLPRDVISCSECYANNLTCDSNASCRSCNERNTKCARWRCSLKHKLGDCPEFPPCKLPHDSQGWLVNEGPRPQW